MASRKNFFFLLVSGAAVVALSHTTACSSSKGSGTGAGGTGASGTGGAKTSSTGGTGRTQCPDPISPPGDGTSCAGFAVGQECGGGDEPAYSCVCTQKGSTRVWSCSCSGTCTGGPGGASATGGGGASATGSGGAKGSGGAGGKGAGGGA